MRMTEIVFAIKNAIKKKRSASIMIYNWDLRWVRALPFRYHPPAFYIFLAGYIPLRVSSTHLEAHFFYSVKPWDSFQTNNISKFESTGNIYFTNITIHIKAEPMLLTIIENVILFNYELCSNRKKNWSPPSFLSPQPHQAPAPEREATDQTHNSKAASSNKTEAISQF